MLAGPAQSGKTTLIQKIIRQAWGACSRPPCPDILLLFLFNSFECRLSFGRNIRFNRNQVLKQDPPVSELYYDQRLDHFKEALKIGSLLYTI
jgi:hypothetical protein